MKEEIVTLVDLANKGIPFPFLPPFELAQIPIPFDILDCLIAKYLPGHCRGWIEFDRKEITPVSVHYVTHLPDLGQLSTIEIYKSGENESTLIVTSLPLASRSKEMEEIAKRHNSDVIRALFGSFAEDHTWKEYWHNAGLLWANSKSKRFMGIIIDRTTNRKIFGVFIFLFGVIISIVANVASDNIPQNVQPLLSLSWPILLILTIISALLIYFH